MQYKIWGSNLLTSQRLYLDLFYFWLIILILVLKLIMLLLLNGLFRFSATFYFLFALCSKYHFINIIRSWVLSELIPMKMPVILRITTKFLYWKTRIKETWVGCDVCCDLISILLVFVFESQVRLFFEKEWKDFVVTKFRSYVGTSILLIVLNIQIYLVSKK